MAYGVLVDEISGSSVFLGADIPIGAYMEARVLYPMSGIMDQTPLLADGWTGLGSTSNIGGTGAYEELAYWRINNGIPWAWSHSAGGDFIQTVLWTDHNSGGSTRANSMHSTANQTLTVPRTFDSVNGLAFWIATDDDPDLASLAGDFSLMAGSHVSLDGAVSFSTYVHDGAPGSLTIEFTPGVFRGNRRDVARTRGYWYLGKVGHTSAEGCA